MADLETTRALVARACRVLGKLELARGTTGHVSARADEGTTSCADAVAAPLF